MRKMAILVVVAAMVAVMSVATPAFATGPEMPSRTQTSYEGDFDEPPGEGDMDRLQDRDRLYLEGCECDAECDGDQTRTRTQTQAQAQAQTQTQTQSGECDVVEPSGDAVKAEVKAGALGVDSGEPAEKPVAASVRAEVRAGEGFFGGMLSGLQRIALRFMAWLGLV